MICSIILHSGIYIYLIQFVKKCFHLIGCSFSFVQTPQRKTWFKPQDTVIPHGPGEKGKAFYLPPGLEQAKEELYRVNGFNALVSDFISLNRTLPDIRHTG